MTKATIIGEWYASEIVHRHG